jgi:molybdenum cofactor cytidylyltransferase
MRFEPTIVVVAAGPGRRFGGPGHKLARALDGSTVLGCTVRRAIDTQLPVVVVTTEELAPLVRPLLATRDVVVLAPGASARGLGASIAAGVAERAGAPGWLVLPGDMARVRPASILAVASALEFHPVVYAQHRGRRGHPIGVAAELYSELIQLEDDEGPRRLLLRYPAHGEELDDQGVLPEVDTPPVLDGLRREGAGSTD